MLREVDRANIALKRFALISPVLNEQVNSQKEYFERVCSQPIEMPYYGLKHYRPKTLKSWLDDYRRAGLDGLRPGHRSDRGTSRKVEPDIAEKINEKRLKAPRLTRIQLWEDLVKEGVILPEKLSQATFYRFLAANPVIAAGQDAAEEKELKRFAHQRINELWQADLMYGPYIKDGKGKKQTYLVAFIDDASRLITAAQFFFSQNFEALRITLKEAVSRRGVPKMLFTDNGKIYCSNQLAIVCASLGCSLIHAQPFSACAKGKIERFFRTVRQRFLTRLIPDSVKNLEDLNLKFWAWLEEDYQRKLHSALKMSPLDFFMSQVNQITIFSTPPLLDEYFLLRVQRKVNHDATLSIDNILFETTPELASTRIEVRYDPEWLSKPNQPLLLFQEGQKVGEARQVNFHDNAHVKRRGPGRTSSAPKQIPDSKEASSTSPTPSTAISFASFNSTDEQTVVPQEAGDS
ncbi:MAG: DDE-type integrase/transposase/recombinase [Desulfitobacterium hafniense]|nr:DDE-type integrase/transposase/recombinase [Desulfitobacterium hafniense]